MNKVRKLVSSNTFVDTTVLFTGSMISSLIAIVFTIIVGRNLGPEIFGIFSAAVSFIAIMNAVGDFGLGASLFRFFSKYLKDNNLIKSNEVLQTIFSVRIVTALLIAMVLIVLSPFINPIIFKSNESMLMVYSALSIAGYLTLDFQVQVFQAQRRFALSSIFNILVSTIRVIAVIIISYMFELTLINTMVVYALSSIFTFAVSCFWQRTKIVLHLDYKNMEKGMVSFSSWMAVSRIIGSINGRIDTLLILQILTPYQTGIFAAARQISFGIPILAGSYARVLAPRYASLPEKELKTYFMKSIWLTLVLCLGLVFGIVISPFVISLFGDKYSEANVLLKWLIAGSIPFMLSVPAVNILIYAFSKPKLIATLTVLQMPLVIFGILFLSASYGIYAPVIVSILSNVFLFVVTYSIVVLEFRKIK